MPEPRYRAAQSEQWCFDAKSVSICGCGGTSDMTCATSNDAHGTAADDGSPLAAKFAQAVRMRSASGRSAVRQPAEHVPSGHGHAVHTTSVDGHDRRLAGVRSRDGDATAYRGVAGRPEVEPGQGC
jgi:hypothetical protein